MNDVRASDKVLLELRNVHRQFEQGGTVIEVLRDASLRVSAGN